MRAFARAGVWETIRHHLVVILREREGREPSPSAAVIDTQSVKTTEKGAARAFGDHGQAGHDPPHAAPSRPPEPQAAIRTLTSQTTSQAKRRPTMGCACR